jgi:hypothetical protein
LERRQQRPREPGVEASEDDKCATKRNKNYRMKLRVLLIRETPPDPPFQEYRLHLPTVCPTKTG